MIPPTATYPRRPRFFANRFCRLMTKVCLANQIGPEACYLLMTVAMTEDAKSYRGSVTFWNEQLMAVLGINSVKSLIRVRNRAIESGWLHYEQGGKGVVGKYWVTVPADYEGMDDTPIDEDMTEYQSVSHGENDTRRAGEGQEKGRDSGMDTTGEVATILTCPLPVLEESSEPPAADSLPAVRLLTFPTVGKGPKEWHLTDAISAEWGKAYPGVDVLAECRKALAWVNANPSKRKTARGMQAFLVRWLSNANDSGRAIRPPPPAPPPRPPPVPMPPPPPPAWEHPDFKGFSRDATRILLAKREQKEREAREQAERDKLQPHAEGTTDAAGI